MAGTRCAVLGKPVSHSLSPLIHRTGYAWLGLKHWHYLSFNVTPEDLAAFVGELGQEWRGLSITMPLKEAAAVIGDPDPVAAATGAANTLVFEADGTRAYNTDVPGLLDALDAAEIPAYESAAVLGSGATARSVVMALSLRGCKRVEVLARTPERGRAVVAFAEGQGLQGTLGEWGKAPQDAELFASTVPSAGLAGQLAELPGTGVRAVFDAIYDPWPTPLAALARAAGLTTVSGADLLVHQARHQLRLMTGQDVPAEPLLSAVRAELGRRAGV